MSKGENVWREERCVCVREREIVNERKKERDSENVCECKKDKERGIDVCV